MIQSTSFEARGIIAVDKKAARLLFLDPVNFRIVSTLPHQPSLPHELAISPDRSKAYVPSYGDGIHGNNPHPNHFVSVIDLADRVVKTVIDITPFESPHTLRFGRDGMLYVCCENSHVVIVIDSKTDRVVDHIDTGSTNTHRLTVLPGRMLAFTENEEDASVSVLDLKGRKQIATLPLHHPLNGIAASPDESYVVLTDADEPRILFVDVDTGEVKNTVSLNGHHHGGQVVRFSPNGEYLLVIGDQERVATLFPLNTDGHCHQYPVAVGNKPMDGAFSPDGKTLLIANESDATISVIDLASRSLTRTVPAGEGCETLGYF